MNGNQKVLSFDEHPSLFLHNKIQEKTGNIRAKDSNAVQNKKDPVGKARRPRLGVSEPSRAAKGAVKLTGVVAVSGRVESNRLKQLDKLDK